MGRIISIKDLFFDHEEITDCYITASPKKICPVLQALVYDAQIIFQNKPLDWIVRKFSDFSVDEVGISLEGKIPLSVRHALMELNRRNAGPQLSFKHGNPSTDCLQYYSLVRKDQGIFQLALQYIGEKYRHDSDFKLEKLGLYINYGDAFQNLYKKTPQFPSGVEMVFNTDTSIIYWDIHARNYFHDQFLPKKQYGKTG